MNPQSQEETPIASTPAIRANTALLQPTDPLPSAHNPKRQRRPSVRLGEIRDQRATLSHNTHSTTRSKPQSYRQSRDSSSSKPKKAPPIGSLVNINDAPNSHESELLQNSDAGIESDRREAKRGNTKRGKSNCVSTIEEGQTMQELEERPEFGEPNPDSDSQMKFQESPVRSIEGLQWGNRGTVGERVKSWLIDLGLGRYCSVFEMNEVDDEVLPLLTLEDLKDMGINAVGSRRKLYSAIQKLRGENS